MTIGENIRMLRQKRNISQKELAGKILFPVGALQIVAKPRKIRKDAVSDVSRNYGAEGNRTPCTINKISALRALV